MLVIENLKVAYASHVVLDNLSVCLQPGCIHGFVGLNGAGKTTFLNTLYGLKKKCSGKICWDGKVVERQQMAYLETENLFYSHLTGKEYLSLFRGNASYDTEIWNRLFRLPLNQLIESYSTGMKRKLALMGVLKQDRPVLILDEPFNGLDIESTRILMLVLQRLRQQGKTILLTSHLLESLTALCDYIYLLKDGKIVLSRGKQEFDRLEKDIFQGLEKEYNALLNQLL